MPGVTSSSLKVGPLIPINRFDPTKNTKPEDWIPHPSEGVTNTQQRHETASEK